MGKPEHPSANKILEYRSKSLDAAERAIRATDLEVRKSWDAIARSYHDMAERLERQFKP
jgi:hypothetical protein